MEMEEFLPAPRSLRLSEREKADPSLQESLVGAMNEFQATLYQKAQQKVQDILTRTKCFTYLAVVAKGKVEMVPCMVMHLHTVFKLYLKAPQSSAWLEYDFQFRTEAAAAEDGVWSCGDSWQFISCLPGPSRARDPFEMVEEQPAPQPAGAAQVLQRPAPAQVLQRPGPAQVLQLPGPLGQSIKSIKMGESLGKGKGPVDGRPPLKKQKKGLCRWFNTTPMGCPYGEGCVFVHRCTNYGALDSHTTTACPTSGSQWATRAHSLSVEN